MESGRIQELEDANKSLRSTLDIVDREVYDLGKEKVRLECKLAQAYSDLEGREHTLHLRMKEVSDLHSEIETLRSKILILDENLTFTRELFREEREERRLLSDRIQEASGFKERTSEGVEVKSNSTEDAWASLSKVRRSRLDIKRQLEERAARILKENKEKEAKAIKEGKLAEVVSMEEIRK